jgi:predicted dehydrogenase
MMEQVRIAIVGAGTWGAGHARIYNEHPGAVPVAICDVNEPVAAAFAEEHQIPETYSDHREMLEKCDCDAVAIVTPDFLHADIAVACANAKKHLLIEKPLATTREDVLRTVEAIESSGIRAMVDLHNRWNPPFNAIKQLVSTGRFGKAISAHCRLTDKVWVATDMLSWVSQSSILWFLGSHSLDTMNWLIGDLPKTVYAVKRDGKLRSLGIEAVDSYMTTIQYGHGAIAQMENAWVTPNGNPNVNDFKFNLLCEEGKFDVDASSHNLLQVTDSERMITHDILVQNSVFGQCRGFAFESIRSFIDRLLSGEEFHVTLREAANVSLAILGIMQSADTGVPVDVERI